MQPDSAAGGVAAATAALAHNFPATRAMLGHVEFSAAAQRFFADCPPRSPVLARYGGRFPRWLGAQAGLGARRNIADVAAIDRMLVEASLADEPDDVAGIDPATIADGDWPHIDAVLHPATRFAWFPGPALSLWWALRAGAGKSLAARPREGEGVLVTRAGGRVRVDAIGRAAHRVLGGMVLGEPIGDAAAAAARLYPDDPVAYAVALLVETSAIARFQWKGHRQ